MVNHIGSIQKFVARKTERYRKEGKLVDPALELAYMLKPTNQTTLESLNLRSSLRNILGASAAESGRDLVGKRRKAVEMVLTAGAFFRWVVSGWVLTTSTSARVARLSS